MGRRGHPGASRSSAVRSVLRAPAPPCARTSLVEIRADADVLDRIVADDRRGWGKLWRSSASVGEGATCVSAVHCRLGR
jgi:hypothetical protein